MEPESSLVCLQEPSTNPYPEPEESSPYLLPILSLWRCMGEGMGSPTFLDLGTSCRWVVSFIPWPLCPEERARGTHWIGGWVGPRAGLDDMEKWKFLPPPWLELQPFGRPAHSQSLYRLHYPCFIYPSNIHFNIILLPTFKSSWKKPFKLRKTCKEQPLDI
jgi:hypothetical protein